MSKTHNLIALASLLTLAVYYPPATLNIATVCVCFIGNVVGSLMPDMDQAANDLWDMLPAGNLIGKILRTILVGHRTISHSIVGTLLTYKILLVLTPKILNSSYINTSLVIASVMIGVISHILADSLTKEGIPLFFPITIKIGIPSARI